MCLVGNYDSRVRVSLSSFRFTIGLPHGGGGLRCRSSLRRIIGATLL